MGDPSRPPSPLATSSYAGHRKKVFSSPPLLPAAVGLICVLPYLPAIRYGFVYDDDVQVLQNPLLASWQSLGPIFLKPSWSFLYSGLHGGYYRPLFLVWLSLNRHLFGFWPVGWHLASLALHATVCGLFFLLLGRHGFPAWIAFFAALFFGLHPVHIESVAWVSGSTDLVAAAALLASLLLWWKGRETRGSGWMAALSLACYAAGLLAKETAMVFPAIVFAYACFAGADGPDSGLRRLRGPLREALPFAAVALLYLLLRRAVLGSTVQTVAWAGLKITAATAPSLLLFYARQLVWPANLSLFYN
ncbi:MAG TPA: hypothetical protein VKB24_12060, partial [Candidatus Acidoferrum sp.]|nr:hypothetical protein [Candidatus Acidoferrum sp.]